MRTQPLTIQAAMRRLAYGTAALFVGLGLVGLRGYTANRDRAHEGQAAHAALCALKDDLENRVAGSRRQLATALAYLHDHPNGAPGIPASLIRSGVADRRRDLASQERTVATLTSTLGDCPTS